MPWTEIAVIGAAALLLYALLIGALLLAGRRVDARALAGFIPDSVVLFRRLLADHRVPRRRKVALGLLVAYLASPIDLVPDFIPGLGQLDDLIVAALALRYVLRGAGPGLLREHWPGPSASLQVLLRCAYGASATETGADRPAERGAQPPR